MESYHLFAWGANSHGQLCLGYGSEQEIIPAEIDLSKTSITPLDIVKIVGGAGHTLILTESGRLYSCGWNKKGQAGISRPGVINNLQTVDGLNCTRIKDVACGWDSSIALTENGEVYTWGSNAFGQLGRNIAGVYTSVPGRIEIASRVKRIAMGLRHTVLVTEDGGLLVSGAGSKAQLGIIDANDLPRRQSGAFQSVPGLANVDDVACGQYFTVALTTSGEIYGWGCNKYGQLGGDSSCIKEQRVPVKLDMKFGGIQRINCGWTHAGVLTGDGRVFSWGRNTYGQLGCRIRECSWVPGILERMPKITQFCVGSEHNVALDVDGNVLTWGWNEHGNCGNGSTENVWCPAKLSIPEDYKGVLIGSGPGHSFAVMKKINPTRK